MPPVSRSTTLLAAGFAGTLAVVAVVPLTVSTRTTAAQPVGATGMGSCAPCHQAIVNTYRRHGMSRSLGAAGAIPPAVATNPVNGNRYELTNEAGHAYLVAKFADGGLRRQRVVARIGAGIFATSWVTAEMHPDSGATLGRLFFAPLETIAGHGAKVAPFDLHKGSPSLDQGMTLECLTCHTTDRPARAPFPANLLGSDGFDRLSPLTCSACHGDAGRHVEIMNRQGRSSTADIGLVRLRSLKPASQRDVCARCHLQGDVRIELVSEEPHRDGPLPGRIPVLVTARADDDFRFVGQLERLALSACFQRSPQMTCTTCHWPHSGVAAQGRSPFDAACAACHASMPKHPPPAPEKAGAKAPGCVDCHVRRDTPFDLPNVRTVDHRIVRRVPRSPRPPAVRQFADREGSLVLFDEARLADSLRTSAGQRWLSGVLAMGLVTMGRVEEAAARFDAFPPPGTPAARRGSAPPPLTPLETQPSFHTARGLTLMATGRFNSARSAFTDALTLDPLRADARLARARISFDVGDIPSALLDTQMVIEAYPEAEQPWDLRAAIARRAGRDDLALSAVEASVKLWPSNARAWLLLSELRAARGDTARANQARARARALSPSLVPK